MAAFKANVLWQPFPSLTRLMVAVQDHFDVLRWSLPETDILGHPRHWFGPSPSRQRLLQGVDLGDHDGVRVRVLTQRSEAGAAVILRRCARHARLECCWVRRCRNWEGLGPHLEAEFRPR